MKTPTATCDSDCDRFTDENWHSTGCRWRRDDMNRLLNEAIGGVCKHQRPHGACELCVATAKAAIAATPALLPAQGWQCPVCKTVWAPAVQACQCAKGVMP